MSNKEILKKSIEKAVKNGFGGKQNKKYWLGQATILLADWLQNEQFFEIIFCHDFLKTFFGKERVCPVCGTTESNKEQIGYCKDAHKAECVTPFEWNIAWKYHGCRMLLEKNPIKYLEKFIS